MKVAIITITNGQNYGNRLQNYAVQTVLKKNNINPETLLNLGEKETSAIEKVKNTIKNCIKFLIKHKKFKVEKEREKIFINFNKQYISFSDYKISNQNINKDILKYYDIFLCGSDQIWNPNYPENAIVNFLGFVNEKKKIAFAPSFGSDSIPVERKDKIKRWIENINYLSVREDQGKKIIEDLTGRKDVQVLVDPTMLLTAEEWDKVAKKPKQLKTDKYILNYFLGELSEKRKKEINRIAKENNCEVINILDKNSPFYQTGPSEFLYLEKNAFLICTDSFHSCVFSIIYDRPFIVFDREDKNVSMNSRIETLLNKFELQDRKSNGSITKNMLDHNYEKAYKILDKEKEKSEKFLKEALDIKEN